MTKLKIPLIVALQSELRVRIFYIQIWIGIQHFDKKRIRIQESQQYTDSTRSGSEQVFWDIQNC